jgi:hypothetical protein
MSFQQPANAVDVEDVVKQRLKAAEEEGLAETVTIEWRGGSQVLRVIPMPVKLLSYNPGTHRIRAQRTLDAARDRHLDDAPYSEEAQAYLHHLLRGDPTDPDKVDPTFDALKEDLAKHGQTDPGIITRSGILVNGNTRCAALRELSQETIRVGVLPSDAGHDDVDAVELTLQLRREYKRDYTFVNALLAIDERVKAGWDINHITNEFRVKKTTVDRSQWILAFIREAIERSRVELDNGETVAMRLIDFETHQGKLEELYRRYSALKDKAPDEADAMREARLIAIALNKSKTDARLIEHDFGEKYLAKVEPAATAAPAAAAVIPGTTLQAPAPAAKVAAVRAVADRVLKARAVGRANGGATAVEVTNASKAIQEVGDAVENGLDREGRSSRLKKVRYAAADRISDANDDLALAQEAVTQARATSNFDPEDLDEPIRDLRQNLRNLARLVARDGENLPEGLQWLHAVARVPDTPEA